MGELGEVFQQLSFATSGSQKSQHITHGEACAPYTRLTETNSRVDGDPLKQVHGSRLEPFRGQACLNSQPCISEASASNCTDIAGVAGLHTIELLPAIGTCDCCHLG